MPKVNSAQAIRGVTEETPAVGASHATSVSIDLGDFLFSLLTFHKDKVQAFPRDLQVAFDLQGGHAQGRAVVLEALRGPGIGRQVLTIIHFEAQQVRHGVLVFGPVQTPQHRLSACVSACLGGLSQLLGQPANQLAAFLDGELRLVIGRHFTAVKHVQGIVPGLGRFPFHQVRIQLIQSDLPFLFFGPVATKASLGQDRSDFVLEQIRVGSHKLAKHQGTQQD